MNRKKNYNGRPDRAAWWLAFAAWAILLMELLVTRAF